MINSSEEDGQPNGDRSWWPTVAIVVIGILLVLVFVALHLSGALGPGLHGGN